MRVRLIEPIGVRRPLVDGLRQDRGNVLGGLAPLLFHRVGLGRLVLSASVVAQPIDPNAEHGAVVQRHGIGYPLTIDEGAVGRGQVTKA